MTDNDLFDVAQAVTSAFDRGIEFMMRLVLDPRKDVRYLRAPDCWICTSVTTSCGQSFGRRLVVEDVQSFPQPVSHRIQPSIGCSINTQYMGSWRLLFTNATSLVLFNEVLPPRTTKPSSASNHPTSSSQNLVPGGQTLETWFGTAPRESWFWMADGAQFMVLERAVWCSTGRCCNTKAVVMLQKGR